MHPLQSLLAVVRFLALVVSHAKVVLSLGITLLGGPVDLLYFLFLSDSRSNCQDGQGNEQDRQLSG